MLRVQGLKWLFPLVIGVLGLAACTNGGEPTSSPAPTTLPAPTSIIGSPIAPTPHPSPTPSPTPTPASQATATPQPTVTLIPLRTPTPVPEVPPTRPPSPTLAPPASPLPLPTTASPGSYHNGRVACSERIVGGSESAIFTYASDGSDRRMLTTTVVMPGQENVWSLHPSWSRRQSTTAHDDGGYAGSGERVESASIVVAGWGTYRLRLNE